MANDTKKRKSIPVLLFLFVLFLTFSPFSAEARGLVPCGGNGESPCTLCHLIIGIDGIIDWGFTILVFVAILVIVIAGIMYIISTGNDQEMEKAKNMVKQALTGAVIVFGAWILVNTTIMLLGPASTGITASGWSTFSCEAGVAVSEEEPAIPICGDGSCTGTETNATCPSDCTTAEDCTGINCCANATANKSNICAGATCSKTCNNLSAYNTFINQAASAKGVDPKVVKAIICRESSGEPNVSHNNSHGLMQVDEASTSYTKEQLMDPETNIKEGVRILAQKISNVSSTNYSAVTKNQMAFAAYNCCANGENPNSASADCNASNNWGSVPKWACPINPGTGDFNMCDVKSYACDVAACAAKY